MFPAVGSLAILLLPAGLATSLSLFWLISHLLPAQPLGRRAAARGRLLALIGGSLSQSASRVARNSQWGPRAAGGWVGLDGRGNGSGVAPGRPEAGGPNRRQQAGLGLCGCSCWARGTWLWSLWEHVCVKTLPRHTGSGKRSVELVLVVVLSLCHRWQPLRPGPRLNLRWSTWYLPDVLLCCTRAHESATQECVVVIALEEIPVLDHTCFSAVSV